MIVFDCVCGSELSALDGQAGRKILCPGCRSDLTVPPRTTARRPEPVPDLGIDTAGPVQLAARPARKPRPAAPRALEWSRRALAAVGLVAVMAGLAALEQSWEAGRRKPAVAVPAAAPAQLGRMQEAREREARAEYAAEEEERRQRAASRDLSGLSPDRRLWLTATPEEMAQAWARRARPGTYRVESARKLMFVLIASLEEVDTGRPYGLRADMNPDSDEAVVRLTEMKPD